MDIEENEIDEINFDLKFKEQVEMDYNRRIKELNLVTKGYVYLRNSYVDDILFKKSPEHLFDICEQFRKGNIAVKSKIEIGMKVRASNHILEGMQ